MTKHFPFYLYMSKKPGLHGLRGYNSALAQYWRGFTL